MLATWRRQPGAQLYCVAVALSALFALVRPRALRCQRCASLDRLLLAAATRMPTQLPSPTVMHSQRFGVGGMRRRQAGARRLPYIALVTSVLRCVIAVLFSAALVAKCQLTSCGAPPS